jgi:ribosomal peptide maturation radical SAM protein 1
MKRGTKILLVSMPMAALERQALGLSLLKACAAERGLACDVRYLNFAFAEFLGAGDYLWMMAELPYTAFAGDWLFTEALYGPRPEADRRYREEILQGTWRLDDEAIARILRARRFVRPFLDHCLATVPWPEYALIGFTSTFEQNIASLALARRLRAAHPSLTLVFGGANWEGEMGQELHRQFPFVDLVCSGEAEVSFPAVADLVVAGRATPEALARVPGIVFRATDGRSVATGPPALVQDLNTLPVPDYSDYFRDFQQSSATSAVVPTLLFETSRGCWWGAKSHCTFCGLNGGAMAFRSKSAPRVLAELEGLTGRWGLEHLEAVDNILDMRYFKDVLPGLAEAGKPWRIFYEVKANLSREQVELLRDAGVRRIQPGIESLSDHVLRLMRKGTRALRNVQLLKWCREYGIGVDWNLLYGFPGETAEDYAATLRLLPAIRFLGAPTACGPVRLDRFSPYHEAPQDFGLVNVRPLACYRHLYPADEEALGRIAYYFDYDYAPEVDPRGSADALVAYVDAWHMSPEPGSLTALERPDGALLLRDTRTVATCPEVVLAGPERAAYEYCDELRSGRAVVAHLGDTFPDLALDGRRVVGFLDSLVENRMMASDGTHYLSLALRAPTVRATPGVRRKSEGVSSSGSRS